MEQVRAASLPTWGKRPTPASTRRTSRPPARTAGPRTWWCREGLDSNTRLADHPHPRAPGLGLDEGRHDLETSEFSERDVQRTVGVTTARATSPSSPRSARSREPPPGTTRWRTWSTPTPAPGRNRQPGRLGPRRQDLEQNEALLQNSYANLYRTQEALGISSARTSRSTRRTFRKFRGCPRSTRPWRSQGPDGHPLPAAGKGRRPLPQHELDGVPAQHQPGGQPFYQEPSSLTTPRRGGRCRPSHLAISTTAEPGTDVPTSEKPSSSRRASSSTTPSSRRTPDVRASRSIERTTAAASDNGTPRGWRRTRCGWPNRLPRQGEHNLELIDAQRRARDAETLAVIAEDNQRQAAIDLLSASGRFPAQLTQPPPTGR